MWLKNEIQRLEPLFLLPKQSLYNNDMILGILSQRATITANCAHADQ
jgi:hypothetical protein